MCKHICSLQCLNSVQYYCRLFKKMLVTSEGCPYLRCYNCPRRAFQTLPRSPVSSMLQLLTSHPGKINSLTMHNIRVPQSTLWHWQTYSNLGIYWEPLSSQCCCSKVTPFTTHKSWMFSSICVIWNALCRRKWIIASKRRDSGVFEENKVPGKSSILSLLRLMVTSSEVVFVPCCF